MDSTKLIELVQPPLDLQPTWTLQRQLRLSGTTTAAVTSSSWPATWKTSTRRSRLWSRTLGPTTGLERSFWNFPCTTPRPTCLRWWPAWPNLWAAASSPTTASRLSASSTTTKGGARSSSSARSCLWWRRFTTSSTCSPSSRKKGSRLSGNFLIWEIFGNFLLLVTFW